MLYDFIIYALFSLKQSRNLYNIACDCTLFVYNFTTFCCLIKSLAHFLKVFTLCFDITMALLTILEFPDPRLRTLAKPVSKFDDKLKNLVKDMLDTMYDAPGIGLAATQVDVHQQLIVMDLSEEKDEPLVFINPKVRVLEQELGSYDEGCLSVPGFYETVKRPQKVKIEAQNEEGEAFSLEAEGLLAICIQHEMDHLNGKLFVDYLSKLKRNRIRSKLEKAHRSKA